MAYKIIEPGVWKPTNVGDTVEGTLVAVQPKEATVGSRYHFENNGAQLMVWGGAILDDRMQYVKVGQKVKITFEGKDKNKKGQPMNKFKVEVDE